MSDAQVARNLPVGNATEIFVRLVDEGVDVWCPVWAESLYGNVYRIEDQPYDRETEMVADRSVNMDPTGWRTQ